MKHGSIALRIGLVAALWLCWAQAGVATLSAYVVYWPWVILFGVFNVAGVMIHLYVAFAPVRALVRAIAGSVNSYREGDLSFGLHWPRHDELGELAAAHNRLADALRYRHQALVHRELLLDTALQNSPLATILCDDRQRVLLSNLASRKLLAQGQRIEGRELEPLLSRTHPSFQRAYRAGVDGLVSMGEDENAEFFYLSQKFFQLNGRRHTLILIKQLSYEFRRQEVRTWKKVIRVISHELNNSLAPITSIARSAQELVHRGKYERLDELLGVIDERARHLHHFISGYASFAKLPNPSFAPQSWPALLQSLGAQYPFVLKGEVPARPGYFDRGQIEQALCNLLKNALESGSPPGEISLKIEERGDEFILCVDDRGPGMSPEVLRRSLLPFYSTKRSGTGLGLALCREIVEAHRGSIELCNRSGGGLGVRIRLPQPAGPKSDA